MSGFVESIAGVSAALPGPARVCEQRAAALQAFRLRGLPQTAEEDWRYTDISELADAPWRFATDAKAGWSETGLLPIDADRIVFVNGRIDEALTRIDAPQAAGIDVLGDDWQPLAGGFPLNDAVLEHPLGQLNTATAQHGVLIRPAAGARAPKTIHVVLAQAGSEPLALQPRIVVDLAENSAARIVVQFLGEAAEGWSNAVVEINQARGSRLEYLQLQEQGAQQTQTVLVRATLQRDAAASIGCFDFGARLARNDVDISLAGTGSEVSVFGSFLPLHDQHIDNHIRIEHAAAHTGSATTFRGIAGGRSTGVFNGKVIVRPHAQKIAATQSSDNLLLSPDAEIDAKPELEIYADDVKCSHGATVGELESQHLFYLQSRGIDEAAARALLTSAFAQTVVEHIADSQLRDLVSRRIAAVLPTHEYQEPAS